MFKNFYTTEMSKKGKTLQARFMKMRGKSGKGARIACIAAALVTAAALILAIVFFAAIDSSNDNLSELEISAEQLNAKRAEPIGAVMADIAYADGEKAVFYYIDGIYVYDLDSRSIVRSFDLNKLDCTVFQQGDNTLEMTVSTDGKTALIVNIGAPDAIKDFKNYRLDLENGTAQETDETKLENPFTGVSYGLTDAFSDNGWYGYRSVTSGGEHYYMRINPAAGATLQYITLVRQNDNGIQEYYVFNNGEKPLSREEQVRAALPGGAEITSYADTVWSIFIAEADKYPNFEEVSGGVSLRGWFEQMGTSYDIFSGKKMDTQAYNVSLNGETGQPYLFIFNGDTLVCSKNLESYNGLMETLSLLSYLDNPYQSALFSQTKARINSVMTELFHSYYVTNSINISGWRETEGEAFFTMPNSYGTDSGIIELSFRASYIDGVFHLEYRTDDEQEWIEFTAENLRAGL